MTKLNKKFNSKHIYVGFIRAGNIGFPMIKNIIKTGFNVKVFDVDTKITKALDKNKVIAENNLRVYSK